jgi:hypothetical protein
MALSFSMAEDAVFLDGLGARRLRFGSAIASEKILSLRRIGRPKIKLSPSSALPFAGMNFFGVRPVEVGYTQDSHQDRVVCLTVVGEMIP